MVLLLMVQAGMAQSEQTIAKGSDVLGIGFGPGRAFSGPYSFGPAFRIHYDHGTFKAGPGVITLGGAAGYAFHPYHSDGTYTSFSGAFRAAWHYNWKVKNLDTYAGAFGGMRFDGYIEKYAGPVPDYHPVNPFFGGYIGAAYYFHKNVGVFIEAGNDLGHGMIGFDFRL